MVLLAIVYVTMNRYDDPSDEGMGHDDCIGFMVAKSWDTQGPFYAFSRSV